MSGETDRTLSVVRFACVWVVVRRDCTNSRVYYYVLQSPFSASHRFAFLGSSGERNRKREGESSLVPRQSITCEEVSNVSSRYQHIMPLQVGFDLQNVLLQAKETASKYRRGSSSSHPSADAAEPVDVATSLRRGVDVRDRKVRRPDGMHAFGLSGSKKTIPDEERSHSINQTTMSSREKWKEKRKRAALGGR